jgi:CheY-like chemotaxis protein
VRTANPEGDSLEVTVADSGVGIAQQQLAALFEPFASHGGEPGGRHGGLGLGLAIAKGLLEAHGGRIAVHSPGVGRGTTFTVWLPVTQAAFGSLPDLVAPAIAAGGTIPVLLVEDHADSADALAGLLSLAGCEVTVAHSVRGALAAVNDSHRLLVSDLALPDGSGRDLLRKLREQGHDLDAIVLSGFGTEDDVRRSLAAGFREHLTKPVDVDRPMAAVRRLA